MVALPSAGQGEYPKRAAAGGGQRDFGRQYGEHRRCGLAITYYYRHILLVMDAEGDGWCVGYVRKAHPPQRLPRRIIVCREPAVGGCREDHAAGGVEHAAALEGALPIRPYGLALLQVDGLEPAKAAVAIRARAHGDI